MDKVANIRASIAPPLVQCEDNPGSREVLLNSFSPLSEQDICEIVQQLKPSSCFNDVVPVRLFKEVVGTIGPILLSIVNSFLISGCVPEELKIATVQLLLKKPSLAPAVENNYRPISKLLSKLLFKK